MSALPRRQTPRSGIKMPGLRSSLLPTPAVNFSACLKIKSIAVSFPSSSLLTKQRNKDDLPLARKLQFDWKQNPSHVVIDIPKNVMDTIQWADYRDWDLGLTPFCYCWLSLIHFFKSFLSLLSPTSPPFPELPPPLADVHRRPEKRFWLIGPLHFRMGPDAPLCFPPENVLVGGRRGPPKSLRSRDPLPHHWLRLAFVQVSISFIFPRFFLRALHFDLHNPCLLFHASHLLNDRKRKGEDIFDFCFYFLMFIEGSEFSLKDPEEELDVSLPEHSPRCRNNESRPSPDSRSAKKKDSDAFQNRGNSWQMVSDLGSLGTSLPRRDSFNFIGDEETFRIPSSEQLDTTPVHSISECDCCADRKDGGCSIST